MLLNACGSHVSESSLSDAASVKFETVKVSFSSGFLNTLKAAGFKPESSIPTVNFEIITWVESKKREVLMKGFSWRTFYEYLDLSMKKLEGSRFELISKDGGKGMGVLAMKNVSGELPTFELVDFCTGTYSKVCNIKIANGEILDFEPVTEQ